MIAGIKNKRVLIITYYWPPSGGAGVQRWLKFVKYLREFGWEPIIYTPSNPEAPAEDLSLIKDIPDGIEVLKTEIWEPYSYYKKFIGQKSHEKVNAGFLSEKKKPGLAESISVWVRGNFFIPDARKFWIKPSVKYLLKYLKENPVDAIISTGPPHSMHLIAAGIRKNLNIPWLADFRDPWTQIDFFDHLKLTSFAKRIHYRQEKYVLKSADTVVAISQHMAASMEKIAGRPVITINNGFDPADFSDLRSDPDKVFSLTHVGSLNKDRNPRYLWETLKEICNENPEFVDALKLRFIGKTDIQVFDDLKELGLDKVCEKISYLPHDEVVKQTMKSALLLLLINNTPNSQGIMPGKLFEYLAAKRPILCIGPENGDAAKAIKETNAGYIADFENKTQLKEVILKLWNDFRAGNLYTDASGTDKFSRKYLTQLMAAELNKLIVGR